MNIQPKVGKFDMTKDEYLIRMAFFVSQKSKDPRTKCGVVIADDNGAVISTGYNGFPIGVADLPERWNYRPTKYKFVSHSERNAIYLAARRGTPLLGSIMYFSYDATPCTDCAKGIIQAGIKEVVGNSLNPFNKTNPADWGLSESQIMLHEAGIVVRNIPVELR